MFFVPSCESEEPSENERKKNPRKNDYAWSLRFAQLGRLYVLYHSRTITNMSSQAQDRPDFR